MSDLLDEWAKLVGEALAKKWLIEQGNIEQHEEGPTHGDIGHQVDGDEQGFMQTAEVDEIGRKSEREPENYAPEGS